MVRGMILPCGRADLGLAATLVEKRDITAIKVPVTMVCVGESCYCVETPSPSLQSHSEHDQLFPEETLEAGRQYLESNSIEHEIKTFPEVPHGIVLSLFSEGSILTAVVGFAVIGEYSDPSIKNAQEVAFNQMITWLKSH